MPSDEPITLSATMASIFGTIIASAQAIAPVAVAAAAGASIYSLTRGTPDVPRLPEAPPIPAIPEATPKALPGAIAPEQAADITKPIATIPETARATEAALALRRRQGRASTLLTGPSGLYSTTATASPVKTFLGA